MNYTLKTFRSAAAAHTAPGPEAAADSAPASPHIPAFKANMSLAGHWVEICAQDFRDFFRQLSFIGDLPTTCGLCDSVRLRPSYHRRQEYEFYELRCSGCGGVFSLGQLRDGSGLFPNWKKGWQPAWSPVTAPAQ
jgi:hypothetical protein